MKDIMKFSEFSLFIPLSPPGINETYKYGKGHVYLSEVAKHWANGAALIIGAEAGDKNWINNKGQYYSLSLVFTNWRQDVDAPIKLVIDTLTRKLGFDDKYILELHVYKCNFGNKGVSIKLNKLENLECKEL